MTPETIGRYRILKQLGAGGMGEVYLAEDPALKRQVAIKVLPAASGADETADARLVREAQAAATLDHPSVCAIYEVGEHDGQHFIAMQYVEGETLADRLARGSLPVSDALRIAEQVADALSEAHAHGIVHRDIKPRQHHARRPRARESARLRPGETVCADLSAADAETIQGLTAAGVVVGTTAYMSPEQLRGEDPDARADVFSLGCVVQEMLSGRHPFARPSAAATVAAILDEQPPPLPSHVPAEFQRIVRKCLEKDRERRYSSARDLLIDVRNLVRDSASGVSLRPPRRGAPFDRFTSCSRPLSAFCWPVRDGCFFVRGRLPTPRSGCSRFCRSPRRMRPRNTWVTAFRRTSSTACRSFRS